MADEIHRIETQLQHAFEGEAWHGPALMEVLGDLTAENAAAHPIAGAHSAWEIVLHLIGTYGLVLRRLDGNGSALTPAQDWPPVPAATPSNWQNTLDALRDANEALRQRVLSFRADALDLPLVREPSYSAYTHFIGVTQHDLYHAGQVALLRRALGLPASTLGR